MSGQSIIQATLFLGKPSRGSLLVLTDQATSNHVLYPTVLTFITRRQFHDTSNNNEKFRSFKNKENINKQEVGAYRGFGY